MKLGEVVIGLVEITNHYLTDHPTPLRLGKIVSNIWRKNSSSPVDGDRIIQFTLATTPSTTC